MREILILLICLVYVQFAVAEKKIERDRLAKQETQELYLFDANQISSWVSNVGELVTYRKTGDAGLEWQKGSGKTAVFQSGFWVIGKVDGEIRSAAAEYSSEFQPGVIFYDPQNPLSPGTADNPADPEYQIYSIRRGDSSDPQSERYNREYANWQVDLGAPAHDGEYFTDVNGNGIFDSGEPFEDYNLNGNYDPPDGVIAQGADPPLMFADQILWMVYNDLGNNHNNLWKTAPLGIEVQSLIFGYDTEDPLQNVMFAYEKVINKSGNRIDSLYFAIWTDADIGDATDDYVGCDPQLNLGYTYNGKPFDRKYGSGVPAVGTPIFRGPVEEYSGAGVLDLLEFCDNLVNSEAAAFGKIIGASVNYPDPENAVQSFNFARGYKANGDIYFDPFINDTTTFPYSGDPVRGTGWTEFYDDTPSDHRMIISSGPVTLEPWEDTNGNGKPDLGEPGVQRILTGIVIGQGSNHLESIDALRLTVKYAQTFCDNGFQPLQTPKPELSVSELDRELALHWKSSKEIVENYHLLDYQFEGYNVYQGNSDQGPWTKIASFDVNNDIWDIPHYIYDPETNLFDSETILLPNEGARYRLSVTTDTLRNNEPLTNNREYYFAVSAFYQNKNRMPVYLESDKAVVSARPNRPSTPTTSTYSSGDSLNVYHVAGKSEAKVSAAIVDPLKLQNKVYALRFYTTPDSESNYYYFGVIDTNTASAVMTDTLIPMSEISDNRSLYETDPIDGFQLRIKQPSFSVPKHLYKFQQTVNVESTSIDTFIYPAAHPGGVDTLALIDGDTVMVDTLCGWEDQPYNRWSIFSDNTGDYFLLIRYNYNELFLGGTARHLGFESDLASDPAFFDGGIPPDSLLNSDIELRFTETGQKATFWSYALGYSPPDEPIRVPFEVWDIENNRQLCVGIIDNNSDSTIYNPVNNSLQKDWIVIIFLDYDTYKDSVQSITGNPNLGWLFWFDSRSVFSTGDVCRLQFLNPVNSDIEEFRIIPFEKVHDFNRRELKVQMKRINVFPNPYFGYNSENGGSLPRHVTFINLPERKCIIRVYTLGGALVKKIIHEGTNTYEEWDLRNQDGRRIASGIYIIHVEVKDVGNRILKLAVMSRRY